MSAAHKTKRQPRTVNISQELWEEIQEVMALEGIPSFGAYYPQAFHHYNQKLKDQHIIGRLWNEPQFRAHFLEFIARSPTAQKVAEDPGRPYNHPNKD